MAKLALLSLKLAPNGINSSCRNSDRVARRLGWSMACNVSADREGCLITGLNGRLFWGWHVLHMVFELRIHSLINQPYVLNKIHCKVGICILSLQQCCPSMRKVSVMFDLHNNRIRTEKYLRILSIMCNNDAEMGSWVNQAPSIWKYCAECGQQIICQNRIPYHIYVHFYVCIFNIIETDKSMHTLHRTQTMSVKYLYIKVC